MRAGEKKCDLAGTPERACGLYSNEDRRNEEKQGELRGKFGVDCKLQQVSIIAKFPFSVRLT
jgi:hypothetical protein